MEQNKNSSGALDKSPEICNPLNWRTSFCPLDRRAKDNLSSPVLSVLSFIANHTHPKAIPYIGSVILYDTHSAFIKRRHILNAIFIANKVVDEAYKFKNSTHEFELRRGLRQVDPLSPFLFLITNKGQNGILNAIVDACLFFGYTLGQTEAMHDSHLLFADYGRENWVNMTALKSNLILFEVISGLKVNFHKSLLVRVNVFKSWMVDASLGLNCKIGYIPFLYPIFS
ncbi:hypothetical protein MTR_3g078430 [Medicago truncatula]|uniref:RNA-directed DNA polymerase n=1 Tax=Medicago truncatula TaxID=3880 RepID=A0A072UZ45_MEDTR|nr:hypothetical protein MTR_3g078430 [Medicago truncatula]